MPRRRVQPIEESGGGFGTKKVHRMASGSDALTRCRIVVAITGATGSILGIRLLEALRELHVGTHLVASHCAERTIRIETTTRRTMCGNLPAPTTGMTTRRRLQWPE